MSTSSQKPAAPTKLRELALSYNNADSQASALRLVLALFPDWEHTEGKVEFIRFKDGITNTLLKAVKRRPGYSEEEIDKEAVLLRAYGKGTDVLIDRERETMSHSLLCTHKLAPPLLARFQNGLMYRYIRGRVCTPEDLSQESVWRGVARRMAEYHAILPVVTTKSIPKQNGISSKKNGISSMTNPLIETTHPKASLAAINGITPGKVTPNVWTVIQKWIFALPIGNEAEQRRQAVLQQELGRTVEQLGSLPQSGIDGFVFSHCDLLSGNVIVHPRVSDKSQSVETVSFIDYEYATPAPAAFDLANHFSEWGGFDCDYNVLPIRSIRRAFIAEYVTTYASHTSLPPEMQRKYANRLFDEVDLYRGIPGLYWGIWALIQATISQIDFDYASYAEVRLKEYWDWRNEEDGTRENQGKEMPLRERRWSQE